ncbi:MAG: AraC family transcriptional regulator [Gemmatimonadota bacterium]|jgi:AraC-like DNA-binding protein
MALIALCTGDRRLGVATADVLAKRHAVARAGSWDRALRLVRERPVSVLVVDVESLAPLCWPDALGGLRLSFPHVSVVALARGAEDPLRLFRLGRAGVSHLVLLPVDSLGSELPRAVARARENDTPAIVTRELSPYLPRRELGVVGLALEEIHRRPSADEFARRVGLSRPFLSECLKTYSLPSTGRLLIWARLLHAGRWLAEPGRTGESVARQLEYNDGSAFRRALRSYTGATPTHVAEGGGLSFVLGRFMDRCGFPEPGTGRRVSVA